MTTKEKLAAKIKKKFGTKAHFARVAGILPYDLQKMFARPVLLPSHVNLIKEALKKPNKPKVDQDKLQNLKACIDSVGGCYKFTLAHPEFSQRLVYKIYSGGQKRESEVFKRLLVHFSIE